MDQCPTRPRWMEMTKFRWQLFKRGQYSSDQHLSAFPNAHHQFPANHQFTDNNRLSTFLETMKSSPLQRGPALRTRPHPIHPRRTLNLSPNKVNKQIPC
jgi:hypothetical protein